MFKYLYYIRAYIRTHTHTGTEYVAVMCKYANLLFAHHSSHSHTAKAHHSPCPLAMHFIADCKQNCNSINKLNKNKYEYAASDFCLPLLLLLLTPYIPLAVLIRMTTVPRPSTPPIQPHCLPNQPGNDLIWMHALLCISIVVRFYGKILIKRCFRVHFLPNSATFYAVPVCFRVRDAQSLSVHMSDNRNVFSRVLPAVSFLLIRC